MYYCSIYVWKRTEIFRNYDDITYNLILPIMPFYTLFYRCDCVEFNGENSLNVSLNEVHETRIKKLLFGIDQKYSVWRKL